MFGNFGQYLKSVRKRKNITLTQLSVKTGLSQPYLSQIENGKRGIPKPEIVDKLCIALDDSKLMAKGGYINNFTEDEKEQLIRQLYEIYASTESEAVATIMANTIDFINGR